MEIRIQPRDEYLYVHLSGTLELVEAKRVSAEFLDASIESGLSNILVDARHVQGYWTTMERFEYASFMVAKNLERLQAKNLKNLRIAYVGSEPILDPERFAETVAVNRGVNIRAMTDIEEALEWLGIKPLDKRW
jgi:hypothetical protein